MKAEVKRGRTEVMSAIINGHRMPYRGPACAKAVESAQSEGRGEAGKDGYLADDRQDVRRVLVRQRFD